MGVENVFHSLRGIPAHLQTEQQSGSKREVRCKAAGLRGASPECAGPGSGGAMRRGLVGGFGTHS